MWIVSNIVIHNAIITYSANEKEHLIVRLGIMVGTRFVSISLNQTDPDI
jgi:hypothetical protein